MTGPSRPTDGDVLAAAPLRWWHLEQAARIDAELFGADAWSAETFWSELASPQTRWYTALLAPGEDLLGYAGLMTVDGQGDVQTVAVRPSAQGRGLGARLVGALLDRAAVTGVRSVMLEVRADNDPAIALYQRFGFTRTAIRRGYYRGASGAGADAWIMSRRTDQGEAGGDGR